MRSLALLRSGFLLLAMGFIPATSASAFVGSSLNPPDSDPVDRSQGDRR